MLSPSRRQVAYALLTRLPLGIYRNICPVRLACVKHAASVRPEPGSNSPFMFRELYLLLSFVFVSEFLGCFLNRTSGSFRKHLMYCLVFKVPASLSQLI